MSKLAEAIEQIKKLRIDTKKNQHHYYEAVLADVETKLISVYKGGSEQEVGGCIPNFTDEPVLIETIGERPHRGIAVDCGSLNGKNPGLFEYRGIDIETGKTLFRGTVPGETTTNIAETIAAVIGLMTAYELKDPEYRVYSDSKTAISWILKRYFKTKFVVTDQQQINLINNHIRWLRVNGGVPLFWSNKKFGENPSDLSGSKGVSKHDKGTCQKCGAPTFGRYCNLHTNWSK